MRKYTRATVPAHWTVAEVARVRGQVLTPGRMVKVTNERGTFAFLRHVTNERTGAAWIDVRDANGALRAFHADKITRVLRKTTRVVPVAGRTLGTTAPGVRASELRSVRAGAA